MTHTIRTRTAFGVLAVLTAGTLALTGCSSADTGSTDTGAASTDSAETTEPLVYQFDEARVADSDDEMPFTDTTGTPVVIKLSDDLAAAVPDGETIGVTQYTVTPKSFSTGICRLDVQIEYADGAEDILGQYGVETTIPGNENPSPSRNIAYNLGVYIDESDIVDTLPTDDELDGSSATYFTADHTQVSIVDDCDEDDDVNYASLRFPILETSQPDKGTETFAGVAFNIFQGDQLRIPVSLMIDGWANANVSATGKWITKTN